MIIITLTVVSIISLLVGKYIFGKWFNHITLYVLTWYVVLSLYELKLMKFIDLLPIAWWAITMAFLGFFLGSITVYFARRNYYPIQSKIKENEARLKILSDNGVAIKYAILFCSIVGLGATIQHWIILINMFGSIPAVLIAANLIYRMRVEGEIIGVVPYIYIISYAGVFLSGLYIAYKNRITLISILPFIAIILKEIASVSRAGMLLALFLFASSFFLTRYAIIRTANEKFRIGKIKLTLSITFLIGLFIMGAGLVRSSRGSLESYSASSRALNQFKSGFFITPSLYLYLSSHVGVLSKYLEEDFDYPPDYGKTSFQTAYNFLSKFGFVEKPPSYERGYLIPMWTNTATYLRPLHSDFGIVGMFLFPYALGMLASFYWYKFLNQRKIFDLVILSFLYVIVAFSFLTMITRSAFWLLGLIMVLIIVPIVEKFAIRNSL